jgi:very-short-patch-repair endonuclease
MPQIRTCGWCKQPFTPKVGTQKFCGPDCFAKHRRDYGIKNIESRKVTRVCRQCGELYSRVYEKSGFCTISCGAKWNIKHGISDNWRLRVKKREGFYVKCEMCDNQVYVTPRFRNNPPRKVCSAKCESAYRSLIAAGENNPMFGRKLSEKSLAKQKRTLLQNHGVTNAFFLSEHRTVSQGQLEILNHLSSSLTGAMFEGEKYFSSGTYRYFVDIFSENLKMIVEYNGDYWHCNPLTYTGSFFHSKKQKYASQIWGEDMERMNIFKKMGYHTITVWESEYYGDKQGVLDRLVETALSCSKENASG